MAQTKVIGELIAGDTIGAVNLKVTGNGTAGQALLSDGDGTFSWGAAGGGGGVSGFNSVYVAPSGTPAQNGVLLLTGLTDAIAKITSIPGSNISMIYYMSGFGPYDYEGEASNSGDVTFSPGAQYQALFDGTQVLITVQSVGNSGPGSFEFDIEDLNGNPYTISGTPDFPTPSSSLPSTLIIAPGDYSIASDFILNDLVNITSLTGQADVNISTSNVKIQSGANNSANPISIVGLNLETSLYIESNLTYLTFENCIAQGDNSFSIQPSGTGSITGTFKNCTAVGRKSFGGGAGVTSAGVFKRCIAKSSGSFGGEGGSTSGYFEYCGGADYAGSANIYLFQGLFGKEGVNVNGYFYYCTGGNSCFASENTGSTSAEFYYCKAGNTSFGYRNSNNSGKYYNCVAGDSCFGYSRLSSDTAANARYYNCTAGGIGGGGTLSSRFYNCHAISDWYNYIVGSNGLAYNCSFGANSYVPSVSGSGKIRNCLNSSFTIVNVG